VCLLAEVGNCYIIKSDTLALFRKLYSGAQGVTRLDGVRSEKQVWPPVFEPKVFRR